MPSYPSLPLLSKVTPINDRKTDVSEAGTVRQVDLSAAQVYRVNVTHNYLTAAQRTTLQSFWATNKGVVVTVAAGDGHSYDCLFTNEPSVETVNGVFFDASVELTGNRV